jgi:hypothetical protein
MEDDMSAHNPIASCCARPRFNAAGGIDDGMWTGKLSDSILVKAAMGFVHALRAIRRGISKVKA